MRAKGNTAKLNFNEAAFEKLQSLALTDAKTECGGLLIGNIAADGLTGMRIGVVEDVYCIERRGEPNAFTFTADDGMDAYEYCARKFGRGDEARAHIIGNFHSHGVFDAYFSQKDEEMMRLRSSDEFYVVYSPAAKEMIARFKDVRFNFCDAEIAISKATVLEDGKCDVTAKKSFEREFSPRYAEIEQCEFEKFINYSPQVCQELAVRFTYSTEELSGKKVLVVGAGTIGNEIVKNLALSGVGDITIVDPDIYKYHNLPRSPLVTAEDVGSNKAIALARRAAQRCPFSIKTRGINADITMLGWGFLAQFDLVISPVDSYAVRKYVDRGCRFYGKTHITVGTGVQETVGRRMLGDVLVVPASAAACYTCCEVGSMKDMESRKGCSEQPAQTQPQVMGFSATVAGVASSAALSCLRGVFHEYGGDICKDVDGNPYLWKISAAEVGRCAADADSDVSNLNSVPVARRRANCEFHKQFDEAGKDLFEITVRGTRQKGKLWTQLDEIFGNGEAYILYLEDSLVYYLAYAKPSLDCVRVLEGSDYCEDLNKLPREHVYKVAADSNCDDFKFIKITFEEEA